MFIFREFKILTWSFTSLDERIIALYEIIIIFMYVNMVLYKMFYFFTSRLFQEISRHKYYSAMDLNYNFSSCNFFHTYDGLFSRISSNYSGLFRKFLSNSNRFLEHGRF